MIAVTTPQPHRASQAARLTFWVPGPFPSPNQLTGGRLRDRMRTKSAMKLRTRVAQHCAMVEQHARPFVGAARVSFAVVRRRRLDPRDNLESALKYLVDTLAVCPHMPRHPRPTCPTILLPHGDGPGAPYEWPRATQRTCTHVHQEGVWVTIEALT